MKAVRCIKNCMLTVRRDDEEAEEKFVFGRWYKSNYAVEVTPEYLDIHLADGTVIEGVKRGIFELGLTDVRELEPDAEPEPEPEEPDPPEYDWDLDFTEPEEDDEDRTGNDDTTS